MTYPGGAPGGYPGPGPQQPPQPQPGFGPPPAPAGSRFTLVQTIQLVVAGLGVLNLFLGFAPLQSGGVGSYSASINFYDGPGWIPGLLFVGGLLALPAILPGEDRKVGLTSPALTLGVTLAFLFTVFNTSSLGAGGIMVLIFALVQTAAAVTGYLFEAGILKPPAPTPHHGHFGQPGGYNPPSGQFQQPYGQPPVPPQQPGGQQTTYAPQQGQFGQPPQPPPPGAPGTPPGGYPQQG
ncbi:DUF5336 domain-containing protein [Actinokineospora enzanensis]|uniref:DUF5336 domain-containing protein n=1 Tax=Actinokineospora enzanensis TaxID=155975 RepID=UPI0003A19F1E|nr:DUF5336 domain-containing protein [Actinokineospora enzanensis]